MNGSLTDSTSIICTIIRVIKWLIQLNEIIWRINASLPSLDQAFWHCIWSVHNIFFFISFLFYCFIDKLFNIYRFELIILLCLILFNVLNWFYLFNKWINWIEQMIECIDLENKNSVLLLVKQTKPTKTQKATKIRVFPKKLKSYKLKNEAIFRRFLLGKALGIICLINRDKQDSRIIKVLTWTVIKFIIK